MTNSTEKPSLLLLVHRIPFPPNKGDKIRSFHLLQALTERYSVRLGCFIDNPEDWQYVDALSELVDTLKVLPLNRRVAKLKSLRALVTREALSLPYYRNQAMQQWVDEQCELGCERAVVFSSTMAQYVVSKRNLITVADFVDVDSDKWSQYAKSLKWPLSLVYQRESKRLLKFERKVASQLAATAFVTEAETALFAQLAPETVGRLITVDNGVDSDYFSRSDNCVSPYSESGPVLVFTGAMDYWANVDAVVWFATELWPKIHEKIPSSQFFIVGGSPDSSVQKLGVIGGVTVTGRVPDVRPYVQYAAVSVAPLRIARGVQNKVLEALALEVPVVMSPQAAEGLATGYESLPSVEVIEATCGNDWVKSICSQMQTPKSCSDGRLYVREKYDWQINLKNLLQALETRESVRYQEVVAA